MYADDTQIYLTFKSSVLGDMGLSRERAEACVRDIYRWMLCNNFKMNNVKTQLLILHSRYRPQPSLEFVTVGHSPVSPTPSARNIGVVFDSTMNFEKHVHDICKSAFFHIRNVSQPRKYLTTESTRTLVNAFVMFRIDSCNSLLYGLSGYLIQQRGLYLCHARLIISRLCLQNCTGFQ